MGNALGARARIFEKPFRRLMAFSRTRIDVPEPAEASLDDVQSRVGNLCGRRPHNHVISGDQMMVSLGISPITGAEAHD